MKRIQTLKKAAPLRRARATPQFVGFITDLIVPDASMQPRPQAYLVEQTPNWTLPTHFHTRHQFQVFIDGDGSMGRNALAHLSVHYASPYSAYGPLLSGRLGVSYLTLRLNSDSGAWYLPQARAHLPVHIPKQQVHGAPVPAQAALDTTMEMVVITPDQNGLAAWLVRLAPGASMPAPRADAPHGGRFYVVTRGALLIDGDPVTALATVFVSRDETLDLTAGTAGLELLVLQFPEAALDDSDHAPVAGG